MKKLLLGAALLGLGACVSGDPVTDCITAQNAVMAAEYGLIAAQTLGDPEAIRGAKRALDTTRAQALRICAAPVL